MIPFPKEKQVKYCKRFLLLEFVCIASQDMAGILIYFPEDQMIEQLSSAEK